MTSALSGLFSPDRFRLAVSADGRTFFDGLSVDNAITLKGVHEVLKGGEVTAPGPRRPRVTMLLKLRPATRPGYPDIRCMYDELVLCGLSGLWN